MDNEPLNKLRSFIGRNPKVFFDHFKNIGVATALAIGAGAMGRFDLTGNPFYLNSIAYFASFLAFAIATILLILNTSYAKAAISEYFFKESGLDRKLRRIGFALAMNLYTALLFSIIILYTYNAFSDGTKKEAKEALEQRQLYQTVEQINQRLETLAQENTELRKSVQELKNKENQEAIEKENQAENGEQFR